MLKWLDKTLAIACWLTAGLLVVMLFLGPAVIANDDAGGKAAARASPYGKPVGSGGSSAGGGSSTAGADGKTVFQGNCGRCHTFASAHTSGQVGPNLDNVSLSASEIESIVRGGSGAMPAFENQLSSAEISAVAAFVAGSP
jgi:mono/diheme cytochrome c family protein